MQDELDTLNERLREIDKVVRELEISSKEFASKDMVRQIVGDQEKSLRNMESSITQLTNDFSGLSRDISHSTKRLDTLFDMHEKMAKEKAEQDGQLKDSLAKIEQMKVDQAMENLKHQNEALLKENGALQQKASSSGIQFKIASCAGFIQNIVIIIGFSFFVVGIIALLVKHYSSVSPFIPLP